MLCRWPAIRTQLLNRWRSESPRLASPYSSCSFAPGRVSWNIVYDAIYLTYNLQHTQSWLWLELLAIRDYWLLWLRWFQQFALKSFHVSTHGESKHIWFHPSCIENCLSFRVYAISHPRYRQVLQKKVPCLGIKEPLPEITDNKSSVTTATTDP